MGQRKYKNILKLRHLPDPIEERENLFKEVLKDSTPLPQTLELQDIDVAFKDWVEKDLSIVFEGNDIPTIALFSAQRFSEYMDSWQNNDDNKNIIMNFKVITRENNPQPGTLHNKNMNIPGGFTYLMKRTLMEDKNGRPYFLDYRMRQPFCVDLLYTVSLVTNKYQLLNEFNTMLNKKFCAIQSYIRPNGHFLPMKLEGITDESEYSMDDRQFFSQSYQIRVMAYIIQEDDIIQEEKPMLRFSFGDETGRRNGARVDIEEVEKCDDEINPYYYQPLILTMLFHECEKSVKFKLKTDFDFVITGYECSDGIRKDSPFKIKVNDIDITDNMVGYKIIRNSDVFVYNVNKYLPKSEATVKILGYNPDVVFDERKDDVESIKDKTQFSEEVTVNETKEEMNNV